MESLHCLMNTTVRNGRNANHCPCSPLRITIASHRIASHRIASQSHRIASHRIASHRIALHRIASLCLASYHLALITYVMCRIDVQFLVCRATSQPSLPTLVQGSLRSTRSFALNNASLSPISGASFASASFACCNRVSQQTGLRVRDISNPCSRSLVRISTLAYSCAHLQQG